MLLYSRCQGCPLNQALPSNCCGCRHLSRTPAMILLRGYRSSIRTCVPARGGLKSLGVSLDTFSCGHRRKHKRHNRLIPPGSITHTQKTCSILAVTREPFLSFTSERSSTIQQGPMPSLLAAKLPLHDVSSAKILCEGDIPDAWFDVVQARDFARYSGLVPLLPLLKTLESMHALRQCARTSTPLSAMQ